MAITDTNALIIIAPLGPFIPGILLTSFLFYPVQAKALRSKSTPQKKRPTNKESTNYPYP